MKNMNTIIRIFLVSTLLFTLNANAQDIEPIKGKVGVLEFSIPAVPGWKNKLTTDDRVTEILEIDKIQLSSEFSFENANGGFIFGTFKELREGSFFSASTIASNVPTLPESWGIKPSDVQSNSDVQRNGLQYAELRIVGQGDGKTFNKTKSIRTQGIWIDLPFQYKDKSGPHSVIASLFYRGPEIGSKKSAEILLNNILNALKPISTVTILSTDEYLSFYPNKSTNQYQPSESATYKDPQSPPTSNSITTLSREFFKIINDAAQRQ